MLQNRTLFFIQFFLFYQTVSISHSYGIHSIISQFNNFIVSIENVAKYPTTTRKVNQNIKLLDDYDFIVIGSGSAGAVIANRLTEIPEWKVLLLEAGRRANNLVPIPIIAPLFQLTPYNWNYTMEKQDGICMGMESGRCAWPRGRALGGSTIINYMIYTRGNPLDYQKWANQGNPGWSYKDVLPYFLKSEDCNLGKQCNSDYHNKGGPLGVAWPFSSEITQAFVQAGIQLNEKAVDYNTPDFMGFSKMQANQKRGKRHSVAAAYLDPIVHRPNLHIITSARVTKILINPTTKQATGVEFVKRKTKYVCRTKKEIILSAGSFNSPQLLMLSGVGPREHLEELGIPVIQNLPVGQTLYDHIAYLGLSYTINKTIVPKTSIFNPIEISNYLLYGKGLYTSLGGLEALAFIKTETSKETTNYPDVELILSGFGSFEADNGVIVVSELGIRRDLYNKIYKPLQETPSWSIFPVLLHPKSKGHIKLQSRNPFDYPLLYGNYLTDPEGHDLKTLISAIRYIHKLSKTEAFQRFNSSRHETPIPGCELLDYDSDQYWECAIRTFTTTVHHQISTCKMGHASDPEAVVDSNLRVYGINNLRVADSSIIPVSLSAHTNAPTIMVGEKASDLIKQNWNVLF